MRSNCEGAILRHNLSTNQPFLSPVNRGREIFGNVQETLLFAVEKNKHRCYVRNNLFTSVEEMIDSFFLNQYKPFKANNTKRFNESNL